MIGSVRASGAPAGRRRQRETTRKPPESRPVRFVPHHQSPIIAGQIVQQFAECKAHSDVLSPLLFVSAHHRQVGRGASSGCEKVRTGVEFG